jgi:hypothetical protein
MKAEAENEAEEKMDPLARLEQAMGRLERTRVEFERQAVQVQDELQELQGLVRSNMMPVRELRAEERMAGERKRRRLSSLGAGASSAGSSLDSRSSEEAEQVGSAHLARKRQPLHS